MPCPPLASCTATGGATPDWSFAGLVMMALLTLLLLGALECVRVSGQRRSRQEAAQDEIMHLVGAVGFQVRGARGVG
jgi:hypothetical protein